MSDIQSKVAEFHKAFGHPVRDGLQPIPTRDEALLAFKIIEEEFLELAEAMFPGITFDDGAHRMARILRNHPYDYPYEPDLIEIADALGDLNVVIHGAALRHGMDMNRVDEAVHISNMSKLGADGKPIYREDGKIQKGPNFQEPDIAGALGV